MAFSNTKASFAVSKILAARMKPFTDGELVKECLTTVVDIICPEKKHLFANISLSSRTVTRRVEEMSADVKLSLEQRARTFIYYSVALDESTDVSDTAQLAVFLRGVDNNLIVTEEFAGLVPMKGTTTGADVFGSLKDLLNNLKLDFKNLSGNYVCITFS
jgi:hypothetical protein